TEPTTTSVGQVTLAQSVSANQDYNMDVTNMVALMTATPSSNFGFELGLFNETCGKILTFGSSKNNNPAKRPKLVVQ
ncbi:DNRLRE domain-containing protein, partial [Streptococcus pneumoniae]|nr:DNRLRE domain-containing protein [Streptococcus pneumoniae]